MSSNSQSKDNWIKIVDGRFLCQECENESHPLTSSPDGMVEADIASILHQLTETPTKIIYGVCPVCGVEYVFRNANEDLFLEASDEEK